MIYESSFIKSKCVFWWNIAKTPKTVTRKFWEKFSFASFNWLKRNREPVDSGRNSMMKFSIVSIDRESLLINRMFFSTDRTGIENPSNEAVALWWISSFFDQSRKRFNWSNALNFEFSLAFWLSVKTLIKGRVVCDEITHVSI